MSEHFIEMERQFNVNNEFEKRCKNKEIKHIDLGTRFRACPLFIKLGYLMIQVFDFASIDVIKNANKFNLKKKKLENKEQIET